MTNANKPYTRFNGSVPKVSDLLDIPDDISRELDRMDTLRDLEDEGWGGEELADPEDTLTEHLW